MGDWKKKLQNYRYWRIQFGEGCVLGKDVYWKKATPSLPVLSPSQPKTVQRHDAKQRKSL